MSVATLIAVAVIGFGIGGSTSGQDDDANVSVNDTEFVSEQATQNVPVSDAGLQSRFVRAPLCSGWFAEAEDPLLNTPPEFYGAVPACPGTEVEVPADMCPSGEAVRDPLWRSDPISDSAYGPWQRVTGYTCATDPVHAAAINAWQSMTITPPGYTWWPGDGWTTTSWGLFPTVDDTPQTVTVDLAGTTVLLRATPTRWVWTQTDGTTHPTTRADSSQADTPPVAFARGPERRTQLTLTTTWEGHYSLNNATTWIQAPGTATTTNPPQSLHIYNPKPRLVDCDLNGHCNSGQTAPTGPVPTITDPDADGTDNHTIPDHQINAYLQERSN